MISSIIIGAISVSIGGMEIKNEAKKSVNILARESTKLIENRLNSIIQTLHMISKQKELIAMGWEVNASILQEELEKTEFLDLAYVLPNGYATYSSGAQRYLKEKEYVKKAFEGTDNISDVMISYATYEPEIAAAVPIYKENDIVAVLVASMDANALSEITKDAGYGEKGYAYMINGAGTIIAHPQKEKVLQKENPLLMEKQIKSAIPSQVVKQMLHMKNGLLEYQENGNKVFAGFTSIKGTDWIFVSVAFEKEILIALPEMIKVLISLLSFIVVINLILILLLGKSITKPLINLVDFSKKVSELYISEDVPQKFYTYKDEIGILSKVLQEIILNFRTIILDIKQASARMSTTAQEFTNTSSQSREIADEVAITMNEISHSTSEQASNTAIGSHHALELGRLIDLNKGYLENLNDSTAVVNKVVQSGISKIGQLHNIVTANNQAIKEIHDSILATDVSSFQIGKASKIISEITEQTNLLALNASIEAARAGEGFAIVAEEIRKLADQSAVSNKLIQQMVRELQTNVTSVVYSINQITEVSKEQTYTVQETKDKFNEIGNAMIQSEQVVILLNQSEDKINKAKNEILDKLQTLTAIAEENAAGTEEVTASIEVQRSSMDEISKTSLQLSKLAENLMKRIEVFNV